MRSKKPPIRIIVPGRTYRSDHDATIPDVSSMRRISDWPKYPHGTSEGDFN